MSKFSLHTVLNNGDVLESRHTADTYAQAVEILSSMPESSVRQVDIVGEGRDESWLLQSDGQWRNGRRVI